MCRREGGSFPFTVLSSECVEKYFLSMNIARSLPSNGYGAVCHFSANEKPSQTINHPEYGFLQVVGAQFLVGYECLQARPGDAVPAVVQNCNAIRCDSPSKICFFPSRESNIGARFTRCICERDRVLGVESLKCA